MQSDLETIRQSIARLREIEAKATPGPWFADEMSSRFIWPTLSEGAANEDVIKIYTQRDGEDQSLITSSRNSLSALLDSLEKATELADILRDAMLNHAGWKLNFAPDGKELPMSRPNDVAMAEKEYRLTLSSIAATMKGLNE